MADMDSGSSFDEQKMVSVTRKEGIFSKPTTYEIAFENFPDKTPVHIRTKDKTGYKAFNELTLGAQRDLVKEYNNILVPRN